MLHRSLGMRVVGNIAEKRLMFFEKGPDIPVQVEQICFCFGGEHFNAEEEFAGTDFLPNAIA